MLSEKEIENIIKKKIESEENLGDQVGGSGHMSFVSYTLDEFSSEITKNNQIKVQYKYTISVETEFTYYPDNPPYTSQYSNTLLLNLDGDFLKDESDINE